MNFLFLSFLLPLVGVIAFIFASRTPTNSCKKPQSGNGYPVNPNFISNSELSGLSEELLILDLIRDSAGYCIASVDLQSQTKRGSNDDVAELPLLALDCVLAGPTISPLLALHDNYDAHVGILENDTAEELLEINAFLDAIFATEIMGRTQKFLASKGLPHSREAFVQIWFGLYSRSKGILGSSGFEHTFLGELKRGVSGFHNWIYFAKEESNFHLNYKGWINNLQFGIKRWIVEHSFVWRNKNKPISSMFVGTSPEFELALYTVCFYARRNKKCPVALNGKLVYIQTHAISQNGNTYVASAYPDISHNNY